MSWMRISSQCNCLMYCTDRFATSAQHPVYYFLTSCSLLHTCFPLVSMSRSELSASTMQLAIGATLSASSCQKRSVLPPPLLSHPTPHNLRLFRARAKASGVVCVHTAAYWSVCLTVFMVCVPTSKTTGKQTVVIKLYRHAARECL